MSPAAAFALHVAAGILAAWAATWAIRRRSRRQLDQHIARARHRARLPEQMFLLRHDPDDLGPDHDWAHKLLTDIRQLPTTQGDR
ncbi:hypothetical protein ACIP69_18130 [Streptomyces hygroscopicus]|uniref:hypothetical protein n=1 Tax=Streptomyces hygroscopicus TaxID=1912 RepID=UPI003829273C